MPPSLISRDFPSNFSCSVIFSRFLFLCFEASPNSFCDIQLWSRQKRDKEVCRRKGIRDCSLLSFFLKSILTSEFKETHNCTVYAKWGVGSLEVPSGGIFHIRPVHTASRKKKPVLLYMACIPIRGYTSSFRPRLKMEFLFYLPPILLSVLPFWIRYEQLYAALFQTVRPSQPF